MCASHDCALTIPVQCVEYLVLFTPTFQAVCSTREKVFGAEFCGVDIRVDMHAHVVQSCGTTVFQGW